MKPNYDVIVIGGGPAGSTAAAVLAMKGRRVLLLEKEKFPRYHIGESLIPYTYFTLERLGVLDKLKRTRFVRKYSVQFVRQAGEVSTPFYFTQNWDHPSSSTWQVVRSEFDQMLLDNAREKGVEVIEEMAVREPIRENGRVVGVRGTDKQGRPFEVRAPVTVDASGRDGFTQVKNGWRIRDPKLNKIAVWTYYKGALRDPGLELVDLPAPAAGTTAPSSIAATIVVGNAETLSGLVVHQLVRGGAPFADVDNADHRADDLATLQRNAAKYLLELAELYRR